MNKAKINISDTVRFKSECDYGEVIGIQYSEEGALWATVLYAGFDERLVRADQLTKRMGELK